MMKDIRRARHLWIATATTMVILAGVTILVKRQFAQQTVAGDVSSKPASTGNLPGEQARRFDADALEFERKLVRRAPFSATLVFETTQSSDGATRTITATSLVYRDAKGRTRRDRMPAHESSSVPNVELQPKISTINDPVAGFTYALEHESRLFRRTVLPSSSGASEESDDLKTKQNIVLEDRARASSAKILPMPSAWGSGQSLKSGVASSFSETKTEQLGEREIEGVTAEGTRITVTLPAGAVNNSEPIAIVTERWYSPELKTVMLISRSDPRYGETIYRLTMVKRDEPAATLFVVPRDYKMSNEAARELFSP